MSSKVETILQCAKGVQSSDDDCGAGDWADQRGERLEAISSAGAEEGAVVVAAGLCGAQSAEDVSSKGDHLPCWGRIGGQVPSFVRVFPVPCVRNRTL